MVGIKTLSAFGQMTSLGNQQEWQLGYVKWKRFTHRTDAKNNRSVFRLHDPTPYVQRLVKTLSIAPSGCRVDWDLDFRKICLGRSKACPSPSPPARRRLRAAAGCARTPTPSYRLYSSGVGRNFEVICATSHAGRMPVRHPPGGVQAVPLSMSKFFILSPWAKTCSPVTLTSCS